MSVFNFRMIEVYIYSLIPLIYIFELLFLLIHGLTTYLSITAIMWYMVGEKT